MTWTSSTPLTNRHRHDTDTNAVDHPSRRLILTLPQPYDDARERYETHIDTRTTVNRSWIEAKAVAAVEGRVSGSRIDARSIHRTESRNARADRWAISSANRVLGTPPGPTSETRRDCCSRTRAWSISRRRPMKLLRDRMWAGVPARVPPFHLDRDDSYIPASAMAADTGSEWGDSPHVGVVRPPSSWTSDDAPSSDGIPIYIITRGHRSMAGNSTDPGRSVTSKVTAILMAFTNGAVLSLTEIAGIAKLPTSTAHRLVSELLAWRLLERTENGGYRIGLPLRIIGKDATGHDTLTRAILIMRARPVLAELARTARTDVKLGALNGHEVVYLGQFGQGTLNPAGTDGGGANALGPAPPAYATAIGKALIAFSPTSVVNRVIAEATQTGKPMVSPDNFRQARAIIRLTHIATARNENDGNGTTIAMPIFSGGGRVAAAVELTVREPCTNREAVTGALTVACRSLSRQLATECRGHGTLRHNENGSTPPA